jgi:hypothetical protein
MTINLDSTPSPSPRLMLGFLVRDAEVVSHAAWAQGNMAADATNQINLAEAGGVEALVAAMGEHMRSLKVAVNGSWCMVNLAGNGSNMRLMVEAGAHKVLIDTMQATIITIYGHITLDSTPKVLIDTMQAIPTPPRLEKRY